MLALWSSTVLVKEGDIQLQTLFNAKITYDTHIN